MSGTASGVHPDDVAAIERATLAAVAPDQVLQQPGWLIPLDPGTIGRAHSAVPLSHDAARDGQLAAHMPAIASLYRDRGFQAVYRLPTHAPAMQAAAAALGASPREPTWVMTGTVANLARVTEAVRSSGPGVGLQVQVDDLPSAGWQSLYLGEGFDPVDGACRIRNLSRAACNRYVTASIDGQAVACGAASLAHGWLGVHGMRTAASHRGRGLAGSVLSAMADLAARHGLDRVFLQVGAGNPAAQRLYGRAGLTRVWNYAYWRQPH